MKEDVLHHRNVMLILHQCDLGIEPQKEYIYRKKDML